MKSSRNRHWLFSGMRGRCLFQSSCADGGGRAGSEWQVFPDESGVRLINGADGSDVDVVAVERTGDDAAADKFALECEAVLVEAEVFDLRPIDAVTCVAEIVFFFEPVSDALAFELEGKALLVTDVLAITEAFKELLGNSFEIADAGLGADEVLDVVHRLSADEVGVAARGGFDLEAV